MTQYSLGRMLALDYLRGFFIVVIVIDHLWRWPSLLSGVSGQGALWVSAAEGFIIISGLLIGYIRGYKNRAQPLREVSKKLLSRAALLYMWLIIMTLLYTAATWYITTQAPTPWITVTKGDWLALITQTLSLNYAHPWVHFLYMYAIFLALTPGVIWLLRRGGAYFVVILSLAGYVLGQYSHIEWLWWLPLFFVPAVCGFYLPAIQRWWKDMPQARKHLSLAGLYSVVGGTIVASVICTFLLPDQALAAWLNAFFSKEYSLNIWRIGLALIWFLGFIMVFHQLTPLLEKYCRRWLLPFGTRSLTAYIIHGFVIFTIAVCVADTASIVINTLLGVLALCITWLLIVTPFVQKIIPR